VNTKTYKHEECDYAIIKTGTPMYIREHTQTNKVSTMHIRISVRGVGGGRKLTFEQAFTSGYVCL